MPHAVNDSPGTMSRPSSTSSDPNAFPKAAGATVEGATLAPDAVDDANALSPSRSTFSFESSPKSVKAPSNRNSTVVFDESRNLRNLTHGAPGEKKDSVTGKGYGQRRRTQYFEEQFAYKTDTVSSVRDRVIRDAPIIADLRTNVIIKDEYTLVTDLSHHLSQRYQRPETSIMITVNHSACLLLGGSFEPTYVMTISALPAQVQPTTNKRNASLIQSFMFESIGVHPERGILKFAPIPEDSLATNGMTMLGEIEKLERQQVDDNASGLKRALTKNSRKSAIGKAKSSIQLSRTNSPAVGAGNTTPPIPSPGPFDSGVEVNEKGQDTSAPLQQVDSAFARKSSMKKRPSTSKHLREKSAAKHTVTSFPAPPPIPEDDPTPKIGKRKSFIAIFRR